MTSSATAPKTDYLVVFISYLSFVVLGMPGAMLGIAWASIERPSIQKTFELGLSDVGALFITTTIGYSLASVFGGRLFGRFSSWSLFLGGSILAAVALLGYAFLPAWWMIVAAGLLAGFGSGMLDSGMNIYFAAVFNARLMNWLHASFGVGTLVGIFVIQTVLSNAGGTWQTGYIVAAIIYFIVAVLFFLTRSRWVNVGRGSHEEGTHAGISARLTLRLPLVWIGLVIFLCYAGLEAVGTAWTSPLLNIGRGFDAVTAGLALGILQGSFTAGRIFFGIILPYFKPSTLIRACSVVLIVTTFLLIINPLPNTLLVEILNGKIYFVMIVLAFYGFCLAPIWALMVTYLQERLGPLHGANAIGFMVAAAGIGVGILPGIAGKLAEISSLEVVPVILLVLSIVIAGLYELTVSRRLQARLVPATT
ncbi:MAG: MFS transporter [Anaerolineaceae bacterium]|nr:MFS transporter [Anaerolineaceae bacterium]